MTCSPCRTRSLAGGPGRVWCIGLYFRRESYPCPAGDQPQRLFRQPGEPSRYSSENAGESEEIVPLGGFSLVLTQEKPGSQPGKTSTVPGRAHGKQMTGEIAVQADKRQAINSLVMSRVPGPFRSEAGDGR